MAEKGVIKKFLLRIVLVTTQVAISRRVIRFMPIIGVARTQEGAGPGGGRQTHTNGMEMEPGRDIGVKTRGQHVMNERRVERGRQFVYSDIPPEAGTKWS